MRIITKVMAGAFTAAAIFIGVSAKAQIIPKNGLRLGIAAEGFLPTGNLHDVSNVGAGATLRLQYGVANNLALTLTSGYYNFFGKTIDFNSGDDAGTIVSVKTKSLGIVPVKIGIKAFFTNNLYFGAEGGAGFETSGFGDIKEFTERNKKNTKLILAPGFGFATKSWDAGLRYESFSGQNNNYGSVALRIAYGFGL